jgi:hypothetical protein
VKSPVVTAYFHTKRYLLKSHGRAQTTTTGCCGFCPRATGHVLVARPILHGRTVARPILYGRTPDCAHKFRDHDFGGKAEAAPGWGPWFLARKFANTHLCVHVGGNVGDCASALTTGLWQCPRGVLPGYLRPGGTREVCGFGDGFRARRARKIKNPSHNSRQVVQRARHGAMRPGKLFVSVVNKQTRVEEFAVRAS